MKQEKQRIIAATIVGNLHRENNLEETITKLNSKEAEAFFKTEYFRNWHKIVYHEMIKYGYGNFMIESFVLSGRDFDFNIASLLETLFTLIDEFKEIYKLDIQEFYK